jgi:hypothetical protein
MKSVRVVEVGLPRFQFDRPGRFIEMGPGSWILVCECPHLSGNPSMSAARPLRARTHSCPRLLAAEREGFEEALLPISGLLGRGSAAQFPAAV